MKKLVLAFCILMSFNVTAQVTITQNEMPESGDALYRTRAGINPFLNYAATGANYVWNFPNLSATTQDSAVYQTVSSTNFVYALTYIDFFFNPNRANHARPGVDIPFNNLLPVTNPYTFYYRNASVYKTVGFGMELAGIPVPIIFSDHDEIYNLPLDFGDIDSSFSAYNISLPTLAYYGYEQSRLNEVDGWGVINTPSGSFDALRVKTTLVGKDTINLDSLGIGFAINRPVIYEYKWLSPGLQIPVMQVNTTEIFGIEIITDIFFYDLPRTIEVVQPLATVICPGSTVVVPYEITGAFNQGGLFVPANIFRAQLSDVNGDFTTAVVIGSVTSNQPGTISCTIPANTPPGTGYRIRVVSNSPAFTGNDNGFDLTVANVPVATASAGGVTEFCEGGSVLLSALTDPTYTYQWQLDGIDIVSEINADHTALLSGAYTVVVTNSCGNVVSNSIDVIVNPLPEHTFAQTAYSFCNNTPVTISASNISAQSSLNYQWYFNGNLLVGEINDNIVTGVAGNYILEITNPVTGCVFSAIVDVIVDSIATPQISTTGNPLICDGDSVLLEVLAVAGVNYQWQLNGVDISGATAVAYTANIAGIYSIVATSTGGCSAAAATGIEVIVNPSPVVPVITASGSAVFCTGGTVQLDIIPEPGVAYQWSLNGTAILGATGSSVTASDSGLYSVIAIANNGCSSSTAAPGFAVQVNLLPVAPVISANTSTIFCEGDSVTLSVTAVLGYNYQWTFNGVAISGAILNQYTISDSTGSYTVFATDVNGCSSAAVVSYQITVNPLPASPVIIQVNDTLYVSGTGNFQWYLDGILIVGATSPFYIPTVNGNYTVTINDINNCGNVSVVYPITNVGIYESGAMIFQVYPNPSAGLFQITSIDNNWINSSFEITDVTGKQILTSSITESKHLIDLSDVTSGIYFLKIQFPAEAVYVTKLIKQ